ncbi:MAG: glycoside hydrolase family 26 protein [Dysgonamonadaceae bacterium]|jgi:mannan endo-1,4-beta-mannosidase|nr:glycoside hydrolase family 26 protein [Dysgonamonadaceae bacterium]
MQKKRYHFLFLLTSLCLFVSCEKPDEPDTSESNVPELTGSVPVNNTVISPQTEKVVFVFDDKIILIDRTKIKLNGNIVTQVHAGNDSLYVQVKSLDENTDYHLIIEKNAIKAHPGKLNTDVFRLDFSTSEFPPEEITPTLAIKNPSPEALRLYEFLKENYGRKIISGTVANVSWNTNEAEWVHHHTGKYPALNAFDYIFLFASPANWIDYSHTQVVEDWWENRGMVSCMWHWNVPKRKGVNDYSFYTDETDFDIREALKPGTAENEIVMSDLQKITNYLLLLKNKNIPVLWRPLHEAKGNLGKYPGGGAWFWWGAKGSESFKILWRLMFNHFETNGLNNLIWVWTSESDDEEWYPGDEYVDIIGRDMYNLTEVAGMLAEFNKLKNSYPDKIITLSECGNIAQIPAQWNVGATWSWFMSWYDYERTVNPNSNAFNSENHQHLSISFWKNAFSDERVISRDKMPDLK